jgi:hypothetical protein
LLGLLLDKAFQAIVMFLGLCIFRNVFEFDVVRIKILDNSDVIALWVLGLKIWGHLRSIKTSGVSFVLILPVLQSGIVSVIRIAGIIHTIIERFQPVSLGRYLLLLYRLLRRW